MAWTSITNAQVGVGAPVSTALMTGFRDNIDMTQGSLEFISSTTIAAGAASADFTGLDSPIYLGHEFFCTNVSLTTDNRRLGLQYSYDNGVTYVGGASQYVYSQNGAAPVLSESIQLSGPMGNGVNEHGYSGRVNLMQNRLGLLNNTIAFGGYAGSSDSAVSMTCTGRTGVSSLVNAVRFVAVTTGVSGTLSTGTIHHYGIRNDRYV